MAFQDLLITIGARTSDEGKLFGSIGVQDIVLAVQAAGVALEKTEVHLPEGPIRQLGEYEIAIQLHHEVKAVLKLIVISE